jgi:hypothetical protein
VYLHGFLGILGSERVGNNEVDFGYPVVRFVSQKENKSGQAQPLFVFFILFSLRAKNGTT